MSTRPDVSAQPPTIVEARGVLCPVPIIRLARAARTLPTGSLVVLLTDDVAAEHDVPAWCSLRGHELLSSTNLPEEEEEEAALSSTPAGPEPHTPNPTPGQGRRHLIRLGPAEPAPVKPAPPGPAPAS